MYSLSDILDEGVVERSISFKPSDLMFAPRILSAVTYARVINIPSWGAESLILPRGNVLGLRALGGLVKYYAKGVDTGEGEVIEPYVNSGDSDSCIFIKTSELEKAVCLTDKALKNELFNEVNVEVTRIESLIKNGNNQPINGFLRRYYGR